MKAKVFNPQNSSNRLSTPYIRLVKSGQVVLSKPWCDNVNINVGDKVILIQDEDDPTDWYICLDDSGWALRTNHKSGLCFNSSCLVRLIVESINPTKQGSIIMPLSTHPLDFDGKKYYALITSSITNKKEDDNG